MQMFPIVCVDRGKSIDELLDVLPITPMDNVEIECRDGSALQAGSESADHDVLDGRVRAHGDNGLPRFLPAERAPYPHCQAGK